MRPRDTAPEVQRLLDEYNRRLTPTDKGPDAIEPFLQELRDTFAYSGVFHAPASDVVGNANAADIAGNPGPSSPDSAYVDLTTLALRGGGRVVLQVVLPIPPAELHRLAAIQSVLERELAEHLEVESMPRDHPTREDCRPITEK